LCGFVGIVGRDFKPVTPSNNEILSQSHRGPDQSTFLRIKNALFIHSRLAIQDLSDNARQPMEHWTEQIVICWAGEIYNFRELIKEFNLEIPLNKRNSDTAVLLELYHSIGIKMLSHLNGIFAIAIYNLRDNTVILARDHFGVKPLYFYFQNETLYFATEIKSILMYLSEYKANHEVVLHYLQSGQITLGTKTMFEGINLVEPGELINFNAENSKICRKKFFDIEEEIANLDDKPNSEEIIYEL
jgi:asparagine synthase (glutamine-hydrolysing)